MRSVIEDVLANAAGLLTAIILLAAICARAPAIKASWLGVPGYRVCVYGLGGCIVLRLGVVLLQAIA